MRVIKKVLFVFGTRPEAIKMVPLIWAFEKTLTLEPIICLTGQHQKMVEQVMSFFNIKAHFKLKVMKTNQSLYSLTAILLNKLDFVLDEVVPSLVLVQGDTTSSMVGALSAYYKQIKIGHIEAGLRSFDNFSPFPEEGNRKIIGQLANLHFAPTVKAKKNLERERVSPDTIHVVGNTVVDALLYGVEKVREIPWKDVFPGLSHVNLDKKIILVTGHRRESFGRPFQNICQAIRILAEKEDVEVIYPVHLNPNVTGPVYSLLSNLKNVHLIDPLEYPDFIYLMNKAFLILTDSGGIQEEAPSLHKPVLIMREVTERTEGVDAGVAKLVGTSVDNIVREVQQLLSSTSLYKEMANGHNPYGDGTSAGRIANIIESIL